MKLKTISELQYKDATRSTVSGSTGKYKRGSVNDLSNNPKSKDKKNDDNPQNNQTEE